MRNGWQSCPHGRPLWYGAFNCLHLTQSPRKEKKLKTLFTLPQYLISLLLNCILYLSHLFTSTGTELHILRSPLLLMFCNKWRCKTTARASDSKVRTTLIRYNTQTAVTNIRYKRILFEIIFYLTFRMLLHTSAEVTVNTKLEFFFVTAVCVLFLIKLRWPKKKSIYHIEPLCAEISSQNVH